MTRRRGTICIASAFVLGFSLCAALILNTRQTCSVNPDHIPFADRARHLFLPLLGPFAWSWGHHVQGSTSLQLIWTAAVLAGLVFARNGAAVVLGMFAAFTWPLFAIFTWGLMVS